MRVQLLPINLSKTMVAIPIGGSSRIPTDQKNRLFLAIEPLSNHVDQRSRFAQKADSVYNDMSHRAHTKAALNHVHIFCRSGGDITQNK